MKCQHCDKPATFHITELTGPDAHKGVHELHLCQDHAGEYLSGGGEPSSADSSVAGVLAQQLKVGQTAAELARLDQRTCPVCGITFYEFRHQGRLGCPHDYICFAKELEPLITNIHGDTKHRGKAPHRGALSTDAQTDLIRLRREMKTAVEREDYEEASRIRDQIREVEQRGQQKK